MPVDRRQVVRQLLELQDRFLSNSRRRNRGWLGRFQAAVRELDTRLGHARLLTSDDAVELRRRVAVLISDFAGDAAVTTVAVARENATLVPRVVRALTIPETAVNAGLQSYLQLVGPPTVRATTAEVVAQRALARALTQWTGQVPGTDAVRAIQQLLLGRSPVHLGLPGGAAGVPPGLRGFASRLRLLIANDGWLAGQRTAAAGLERSGQVLCAQWQLSPEHPEEDACDDLAEDDVGFGPGWYPPRLYPHPPHPYCLCRQGDVRLLPGV